MPTRTTRIAGLAAVGVPVSVGSVGVPVSVGSVGVPVSVGSVGVPVSAFALQELMARLRALLRRTGSGTTNEATVLRSDDPTLHLAGHTAQHGVHQIDLTRSEFQLLELFMRNPRVVLTGSVIHERARGYDFGPASNSLSVCIEYPRRRIEESDCSCLIHTVRGVGYVLRDP